jgi:hypothetical protein
MEAILYKTDGTKKKIKISTFIEARGIVCNFDQNGLGEVVRLNNGSLFLIDEEGKLKNYATNKVATSIAHLNEAIYPHDNIAGDVLLFEDENEFEDLEYGFE